MGKKWKRPTYSKRREAEHARLEAAADRFLGKPSKPPPPPPKPPTLKLGSDGPPCPRCHRPTQIREHSAVSKKMLRQPFYYSRWYYCTAKDCRTTMIMPDEFRVWRKPRRPRLNPGDDIIMDVLNERPPWE